MKARLVKYFKHFVTVLGAQLSNQSIHLLQMVGNYMKLGRWMKAHQFSPDKRVSEREDLFAVVRRRCATSVCCISNLECTKVKVCAIGLVS